MRRTLTTATLFPETGWSFDKEINESSTFVRNMRLPVHGWFRFPAGFSAEWARNLIAIERQAREELVILDPFAGVGTTVLAAEEEGVTAYGLEAQPFLARVARAKLLWNTAVGEFVDFARGVLENAKSRDKYLPKLPKLMHKCFPDPALQDVYSLRYAWQEANNGGAASELTWLALVAILRECSPVGTAPWQYVLPRKSKAKVMSPYDAFDTRVDNMASDMLFRQSQDIRAKGKVLTSDARECDGIDSKSIGLVVTSPPYANNYDYADATRLEMTFLGEVSSWGDLHDKARRYLIRSCSQHVSTEGVDLAQIFQESAEASLLPGIHEVCAQLDSERPLHGGKKDYHLMVAAYFADMARVWKSLRRVSMTGARLCFVVGDSAPYGVYVPVDKWLGELAIAAGFESFHFEKIRERNVKWRNRKHKVPLHEGRLWVEA